jgi:hypothetical protein
MVVLELRPEPAKEAAEVAESLTTLFDLASGRPLLWDDQRAILTQLN